MINNQESLLERLFTLLKDLPRYQYTAAQVMLLRKLSEFFKEITDKLVVKVEESQEKQ